MTRDWNNFFKPSDFEYNSHDMGEMGEFIRLVYAANTANELLCRAIKESPVVYGHSTVKDDFLYSRWLKSLDTHAAKLIDIKELK